MSTRMMFQNPLDGKFLTGKSWKMRHKTEFGRKAIITDLMSVQAANDISNKTLAGIISVSPAVISQLKKGVYRGDSEEYCRRIEEFLKSRQERIDIPEANYVDTLIGRRILGVCDVAVARRSIGLIRTPSGWGKTTALREAARRRAGRCCFIQAGEAINTKAQLIRAVARALGEHDGGGIDRIYSRVQKRLGAYYADGVAEPYLIIADEATGMLPSALNLLRNLSDDLHARAAVVLADTIQRADRFLYGTGSDVIAGGNEQLRRRCKVEYLWRADYIRDESGGLTDAFRRDVAAVAHTTLCAMGYTSKLTIDAMKYLMQLAEEPGAFGNVVSTLENVHHLAVSMSAEATYTVAQLDYAGMLAEREWKINHTEPPFTRALARKQDSK